MKNKENLSSLSFMWYSFLDLICCSLGAVLLMFLIISSVEEEKFIHQDKVLVIRSTHKIGFKSEIGIEFKSPSSELWQRVNNNHNKTPIYFFSVPSQKNSGAEAFLVIPDPVAGRWCFRTFLVDYPTFSPEILRENSTTLTMQIFGEETIGGKIIKPVGNIVLQFPGETSQELIIDIPFLK